MSGSIHELSIMDYIPGEWSIFSDIYSAYPFTPRGMFKTALQTSKMRYVGTCNSSIPPTQVTTVYSHIVSECHCSVQYSRTEQWKYNRRCAACQCLRQLQTTPICIPALSLQHQQYRRLSSAILVSYTGSTYMYSTLCTLDVVIKQWALIFIAIFANFSTIQYTKVNCFNIPYSGN